MTDFGKAYTVMLDTGSATAVDANGERLAVLVRPDVWDKLVAQDRVLNDLRATKDDTVTFLDTNNKSWAVVLSPERYADLEKTAAGHTRVIQSPPAPVHIHNYPSRRKKIVTDADGNPLELIEVDDAA